MAVQRIPAFQDVPSWQQRTALDGRDYLLTFTWNERASRWFLDIADQDGVAIATSLCLVVGVPLIQLSLDERRPPGELVLIDTSGADADPDLDTLATTAALLYYPAAGLGRAA